MEVAGLVAKIIRDDKPIKVNIDVGGLGVGVADRLEEQGCGDVINRVNCGGKPVEPPPFDETGKPAGGPANRRAEMWLNLNCRGHFAIPDCVDCILISARSATNTCQTASFSLKPRKT
jgi:hypothetical protein